MVTFCFILWRKFYFYHPFSNRSHREIFIVPVNVNQIFIVITLFTIKISFGLTTFEKDFSVSKMFNTIKWR